MRCFILLLLLVSCNPVKQVLRSPERTLAVVDNYLKRYPIKSDTTIITVPGDTTTRIEVYYDTIHNRYDSVVLRDVTKTVYVSKYIHDTTRITIRDNKAQETLQRTVIAQQVSIDQWKGETNIYKQEADKWKLHFWVIVAALGVTGLIALILKIKT